MIDLRSDTLTMPNKDMLLSILDKPFGDSGRVDEHGVGGDPTVNELEDYAATLVGKERALFLPSGTMGNHVAMLTYCRPGDVVLVESRQHLFRMEKAVFDSRFGQIQPVFYHLTEKGYPDLYEVEQMLKKNKPHLLCIENTHNSAGGTCIPLSVLKGLRKLADNAGVPIYMDGARFFNAAIELQEEPLELCQYVDTIMFCISKGLGAPIGSLLCGTKEFIDEASNTRKLLGGTMRQAGVVAACGLYALQHNIPDLKEDHRRARIAYEELRKSLRKIRISNSVQTNILMFDIEGLDLSVENFIERAKKMGLWLSKSADTCARMVFYRDINDEQLYQAIEIMKKLDATL